MDSSTAGIRRNYINGAWRNAQSHSERSNPSDLSETIGRFAIASPSDVADAVTAAHQALPAWTAETPQKRQDILYRVAEAIIARKDELAVLLSREEGKTLAESRAEVTKAGETFRYFAGEAVRMAGASLRSVRAGVDIDMRRESIGVVALITPWNFPFSIPAWKTAPALAYGNCAILKPAELTNAIAWELAKILHEAGVPPGVFQLVMGGAETGAALISDQGIDGISFTGSGTVGRRIAKEAVDRDVRLQLELGGKNPLYIAADADREKALDAVIKGGFYSTGQRCTASSRIIVDAAIHDGFLEELVARSRALRIGHALDPETDIGPLASEAQVRRVAGFVAEAAEDGAERLCGGDRPERPTKGYFFTPTIFARGDMRQKINHEEVFGPVISVFKAEDFSAAVKIANATEYGLSAGIFTKSHAMARAFMRASTAGMVMVNLPTVGSDYHVPFGGRGASAYGPKEMGLGAVEFFTQTKTIYIAD